MKSNVELGPQASGRWTFAVAASLALLSVLALPGVASAQWATNGNNINNTNTGYVGVGTAAPITFFQIRPAANVNMGFTHSGGTEAVITAFNDANTATVPIMIRGASVKFQDGTLTERFRISAGVAVGSGYVGLTAPTNGAIFQGNVGIGVSNPAYPLTVMSTNPGYAPLNLVGGTGTVEIWKDTTPTKAASFGLALPGVAAGDDIQLSTYSAPTWTSRLTILNSNGNVGIGTTSPSQKLDISAAGDVKARAAGSNSAAFLLQEGSGTNTWTEWQQYNDRLRLNTHDGTTLRADLVTILPTGSVGIGTTTPTQKLDVTGNVNASGLCLGGDCKTAWSQVGGASSQWTTTGPNVYFNGGYVGIGTAAPSQHLHINGSSTWAGTRVTTAGTGATINDGANFGYDEGYGAFIWNREATAVVFAASNAEKMRMDANGNLGIGTTAPGKKLDVAGSIYAGNSISLGKGVTNYAGIGFNRDVDTGNILDPTHAAHQIHREVNGNKLLFSAYNGAGTFGGYSLVIDAAGNVGVGAENPSAKLDVSGNVNVNGNITASGNISAKYQDLAEWVPSTQKLAAGTVVVLDKSASNHVLASSSAYDTKVAGVVSLQPGIALGEAGEGKLLVATTGRVKIKVDATRGAIEVGDLLVTSDEEGVAMKSVPVDLGGTHIHRPGTIIGKALEPLTKGKGEILVLLSLQ